MANEQTKVAAVPEMKIYWTAASMQRISVKNSEKWEGTRVVHGEEQIKFPGHVLQTNDPKLIEQIESSDMYLDGRVILCKDIVDANNRTALHEGRRVAMKETTIELTENTSQAYDIAPSRNDGLGVHSTAVSQ